MTSKEPDVGPKRPPPVVVNDAPKFDLESYISNYEGFTRLARLELVGVSSRALGIDALHLAITEAQAGRNVDKYIDLVNALHHFRPTDARATIDQEWVDSRTRQVNVEAERLERELKGYKNNLIKESIRMGNEDLGAFYYTTGDYASAFKAYSRMREYCTTPKHLCEMSLKLLLTAIAQDNWMQVQSNVYKLQGLTLRAEDKQKIDPIISPLKGLASLATSQYRDAATGFLSTDTAFATLDQQPQPLAGINVPRVVLTANDIATYGGLCALSTMSRNELQLSVLENVEFRSFLELEPNVRRAIACFTSAKYTQCLEILEGYRADYLLDIYLSRHVDTLYSMIRRKSIIAFFAPFSLVDLSAMASTFKTAPETMQAELVEMISSGALEARIDAVEGVLLARKVDQRRAIHAKAMEMAKAHEKQLRLRLFRINLIEAGLELHAPAKDGTGREGMDGGGRGKGHRMRVGG